MPDTPDISLLCPTRGRPDNMRRLVASCDNTAHGIIEVVFYLDEDDRDSIKVAYELAETRRHVEFTVGPRIVLSEMWNVCYRNASADVFMHCGDDIVFRSTSWDEAVLDVFGRHPDRIVLVHGNDLVWGPRLGTHSFLHRRWVETLGYCCPPYFSSDYNDTWLNELADRIGRRVYLPDVITEHMHFVVGKGPRDRTHEERIERHRRDGVDELYASLAPERVKDAEKLRAVMQVTE